MRKINLVFALTAAVCLSNADAANTTESWGAQIANGLADASGSPLANGSNDLIELGTFLGLTPAQVAADAAAVSAGTFAGGAAAFEADFTVFGTAVIGQGLPNGAGTASDGYFTGVSTNSTSTLGIQNTQVYYWAFNAATTSAATQYGIFTAPGNARWAFPDDTTLPAAVITDISDVPQNSTGILWGSFGPGTSRDLVSTTYDLKAITAVPEPSTYASLLVGFGGFGLAALRRRFKK